MKETLGVVGFTILLIILVGIGPVITIWSINTLFSMNIAYSLWTWLSVVWLSLVTFGNLKK